MGIRFLCIECQRPLNVGQEFASRQGKCPHCECNLGVPQESELTREEFETKLKLWLKGQSERQPVDENPSAGELPPTHRKQSDAEIIEGSGLALNELNATGIKPPVFQEVSAKLVESPQVLSESQKVSNDLSAHWLRLNSEFLSSSHSGIWHVRPPSGGQFGPADTALLRTWIEEGRVTPDSFVWCQGWEDWQLASEAFAATNETQYGATKEQESSGQVTAVRTRTAYLKARQRRTMRSMIGLITGAVVVVVLIVILVFVIGGRSV